MGTRGLRDITAGRKDRLRATYLYCLTGVGPISAAIPIISENGEAGAKETWGAESLLDEPGGRAEAEVVGGIFPLDFDSEGWMFL